MAATKKRGRKRPSLNFVPLGDRIIVSRDVPEGEKKTDGGILIPESAQHVENIGTVIAVGPGPRTPEGGYVTPVVKVGDRIMFSGMSACEIWIDGTEYLNMSEQGVLGLIPNREAGGKTRRHGR